MDLFRYVYAYRLTLETLPCLVFPDCQIMTLCNFLRNSLLTLIAKDSHPWFPPVAYILPSPLRQDANACYQRAAPVPAQERSQAFQEGGAKLRRCLDVNRLDSALCRNMSNDVPSFPRATRLQPTATTPLASRDVPIREPIPVGGGRAVRTNEQEAPV